MGSPRTPKPRAPRAGLHFEGSFSRRRLDRAATELAKTSHPALPSPRARLSGNAASFVVHCTPSVSMAGTGKRSPRDPGALAQGERRVHCSPLCNPSPSVAPDRQRKEMVGRDEDRSTSHRGGFMDIHPSFKIVAPNDGRQARGTSGFP